MNKPKIRFKGFEGEWKERKFGDFGHVEMCKRIFKYQTSSQGEIPFYKIGTFGFQPDAFISRSLYEDYRKKFSYPKKGDILISAAGTIGRTIEYKGEECYYQDSNIVWLNHNEEIDNAYLKQLYSLVTWSSLEGATIKRLYNSNILNTHFNLPSLPEQRALASYFTSLDAQIAASTSRLSSLKQIKAASLLNMFPQKGETVPRVRFKGFQGEWKKVKIGDVAPLTGGFAFQSGQFKTSGVPIIRISNILSSGIVGGDFVYYNEFKGDSEFRLYKGDVVIAMSGATTGKVATFEANDFGYQNQRVGKFSRTNLVNYELLSKLVSAPNFQKKIISKLTSSAQPNASSKDIDSIDLVVPEETEEQRAIASYFTALDAQITLHRERLEKLKQIKAACLEKMFA